MSLGVLDRFWVTTEDEIVVQINKVKFKELYSEDYAYMGHLYFYTNKVKDKMALKRINSAIDTLCERNLLSRDSVESSIKESSSTKKFITISKRITPVFIGSDGTSINAENHSTNGEYFRGYISVKLKKLSYKRDKSARPLYQISYIPIIVHDYGCGDVEDEE